MKKGFTFVILALLVLMPISTVSAQKKRGVNESVGSKKTQKVSAAEMKFGATQAFSEGAGVYLNWQTASEAKTVGFLVYRVTPKGRELASPSLIMASYMQTRQETADGNLYHFYDDQGGADSSYIVEAHGEDGRVTVSAPFAAQPVTDLSAISGDIADSLAEAARNKTPVLEKTDAKRPQTLGSRKASGNSLANITMHRTVVGMPGVKINVRKDGFYRVSRAELQAAGFDVNASPAQWQLFLEGEQLAINVASNGDYLEFIGKGLNETESGTRVYNLIVGAGSGKRMGTEVSRPQGNGVPSLSYVSNYHREERTVYAPGVLNGDNQNYFGTTITSGSGTVNFNLDALDFSAGKSQIFIKLQGITLTSHQVEIDLNGVNIGSLAGNNRESMSESFGLPISYFREGSNTLNFRDSAGASLVDTISIDTYRYYRAVNNQLSFYTSSNRPSPIGGFTSPDIRVFNLNNPLEPKLITNLEVISNGSDYRVELLAGPSKNLVAVENSGVLSVASVTPNAPSALATPGHDANLVIISHGSFMTQAETWANYRRGQGISVEVVNVEDVYDEFGYCVTSSRSIRDFLQYAKTNWQTPPQYVLLLGDSSYDARNFEGFGNFNLIPSVFVDTVYTEVPSDDSLVDFDNDGMAELAIGRIPARTPQAVTDAFNKTVGFELTSAQGFSRGALFASDLSIGYNFEQLSQQIAAELPETMTKVFVNRSQANAHTLLMNEINNGRYIVNYSGHGRADIWAADDFLNRSNVPQMTNSNNLSIFTMLSCLNGYFAEPLASKESLSERLVSATNGGAVAAWSSTGLTTADVQQVMALRFYNRLSDGSIPRLGELVRDAKTTITGGRDVRLSWCLLGDPMLKVR